MKAHRCMYRNTRIPASLIAAALFALLLAPVLAPTLMPADAAAAQPEIYSRGGVAIRGTDPVAYFTEGRPVSGDARFSHSWKGATWHFSSAANRDSFAAAPERYAPRFGGYCAWAVSRGYTASTAPDAWSIVDGRLYLNYSLSVRASWKQNIPGNIAAAEENWPAVLGN